SESRHKIAVIAAGTILYIAAGALSIFSSSLNMLILLSCLLGAGCGLILPFSTGLIADVFSGKYRMKQMGIISAIGNVALVLATFVVGFLAAKSWHLPFLVYLLPLLSLILIPFLRKIPQSDYDQPATDDSATSKSSSATSGTTQTAATVPAVDADGFSTKGQTVKGGFYVGRTVWLLLAYFFFVFATCIPCYYLPNFKWIDAESASTMTSVFYFAMFVVGLALTPCMKLFRKGTFIAATAMIVGGFALFVFTHSIVLYIIAAAICGLGNGIAQPIFYTKATEVVVSDSKSTLSLAYLQVANYVAISLVPVIIGAARYIFGQPTSTLFPFVFVGIATAIVLVFVIIRSGRFVFGMSKNYYE
ncbi:MAG: MFS transporter, partial [Muribaculaceae bacterium]|nr:MFS transporter [Muribaculaceae bacterium]